MNHKTKSTCHPQLHILLHTWRKAALVLNVVSEASRVNVVWQLLCFNENATWNEPTEAEICHHGHSCQMWTSGGCFTKALLIHGLQMMAVSRFCCYQIADPFVSPTGLLHAHAKAALYLFWWVTRAKVNWSGNDVMFQICFVFLKAVHDNNDNKTLFMTHISTQKKICNTMWFTKNKEQLVTADKWQLILWVRSNTVKVSG